MEAAKIIGKVPWVLPELKCTKVPYQTKQEAYKVISAHKHRRSRKECKVYWCEECRAFHLTSQRN